MLGRERRFRAGFSVPCRRSAWAGGPGPPFGRPQPVARAAAATATPSAAAASPIRLATPAGPPPAGRQGGEAVFVIALPLAPDRVDTVSDTGAPRHGGGMQIRHGTE